MAANWHVADLIPDRAYSLIGRLLLQYWEVDALRPDRFARLRAIVRSVGTLSGAGVIPPEASAEIANAFLGLLILRGYTVPPDAHEMVERWLHEGDEGDLRHLLDPYSGLGDPKHKPTPPRPVCRHCGAAQ